MSAEAIHSCSSIKKLLSKNGGAFLHRQVVILAGEEQWQKSFLQKILSGYESESLWVAEQEVENFPFVETKKTHSWLGNEIRVVVFDANKYFDPDSFAAISGIVVGGGLFFLLLPPKQRWGDVYSSLFGQRLIQSISSRSELIVIKQGAKNIDLPSYNSERKTLADCPSPFLTLDQQNSVEQIEKEVLKNNHNPVVLLSDRGRGKSAALGISIAKLVQQGIKNIAVTAPRLRATDIVFKHINEILPGAVASRGCVKYGESRVQFYSPDQLIRDEIKADLLVVDEAAAIPVPLLTSFLHNYPQCVFATTVHGYEGTGRGFSLRFFKELNHYNSNWLKLNMKTPIRWADNDPLEEWMFDLLCLDAELADVKLLGQLDNIEHKLITKKELFEQKDLLNEVFSLLVLAHYRTRPKDLKSLLDDENISLYITLNNKNVVAVALVIQEGGFSHTLSTLVYRGERRPQGHLLAQALTYHCGIEDAATLNYVRIMRVAVHPHFQQQGIGSALLNFIVENEKKLGRDAIGTSFGMNSYLLSFWKKLNFNIVRIGFTREQTSGEHAAIMLLGLTQAGLSLEQRTHKRFNEQIPYWVQDVLKDIPDEVKEIFNDEVSETIQLTDFDKKDIDSFTQYSRNYELCITALSKLVSLNRDEIGKEKFPERFRLVLNAKVVEKKSWHKIRENMELNGQHDARRLFRLAIIELLTHL